MGKVNYHITERNKVVTFRYGRYIESFDIQDLGVYETYERVKYAAITAGLKLSEDTLEKLLREVRGLL
jgi:hypothetical protein